METPVRSKAHTSSATLIQSQRLFFFLLLLFFPPTVKTLLLLTVREGHLLLQITLTSLNRSPEAVLSGVVQLPGHRQDLLGSFAQQQFSQVHAQTLRVVLGFARDLVGGDADPLDALVHLVRSLETRVFTLAEVTATRVALVS